MNTGTLYECLLLEGSPGAISISVIPLSEGPALATLGTQDTDISSLMDEYSGRSSVDRLAVPKRGSRLVSRNDTQFRDQNIQLCNRIGCSGRSSTNVSLNRSKVSKPSSGCSTHGKEVSGSGNSSKAVPKATNPLKPLRTLRSKSSLQLETDSPASSGDTGNDPKEADIVNFNRSAEGTPRSVPLDQSEPRSGESTSMDIGSPSEGPGGPRPKRTFSKKPASVVDSNPAGLRGCGGSISTPLVSRQNVSATQPGSKYLRRSSVTDVVSSDSASSNRKQMLKKRSADGESSSSSRAKQPTIAENTRTPSSRSGISLSETRRARRSQTNLMDNGSAMVRGRRSDNSTSHRPPQMSRRELLPNSHSATGHLHRPHSSTRPSTTESSHNTNVSSPSAVAHTHNLVDLEAFRHYSVSGMAEMLLALDRIGHDEEMSYEQLLALESNLFLAGLNVHDQHREMRLDIDDMSYEELLALEERMGSVSTALSEEALAKCINKSVHTPKSFETVLSDTDDGHEDDAKCSICQEEYDTGDEMGRLHCKHSYHMECIDQWLRQKNWCPICKSSVATSNS